VTKSTQFCLSHYFFKDIRASRQRHIASRLRWQKSRPNRLLTLRKGGSRIPALEVDMCYGIRSMMRPAATNKTIGRLSTGAAAEDCVHQVPQAEPTLPGSPDMGEIRRRKPASRALV
jgi:hypothetical protein